MPSRKELIQQIEGKLSDRIELDRKMRASYNTAFPNNTPKTYQMLITKNAALEHELFELIERVKLLPKEDSPEIRKKRGALTSEMEMLASDLQNKQSELHTSNRENPILNNTIREVEIKIDNCRRLLSIM